jgi:hypothetical protein
MRNLWVKIGLGAGGIFAVGMLVVSLAKFGRNKIEDLFNTSSDIRIPLMGIVPFQLADQKLGDLRRITLLRDAPKHLTGVRVEARLGDSATTEAFKDCGFLTVNDPQHVDGNTRFTCIHDTTGLASFGTVEIRHVQGGEPTTLVRTLMLPAIEIQQLQEAMGPRVRPDSAKLAELVRMGDSLEAMGDSIRAATEVQVRIEQEHGRANRAARGIHVQVNEAPQAPTPPPANP